MNLDPFEKDELLKAVETLRSFIENIEVRKTCSSCSHYGETDGVCKKFNQQIPDHIIKKGCIEWEFESIPF